MVEGVVANGGGGALAGASSSSVGSVVSFDVMKGENVTGARGFEWTKGELLGRGAFGSVYVGMDRSTGSFFAAKQVSINSSEQSDRAFGTLQNEIRLLRTLRHPHVVSYLGCERTDEKTFTVFMEYVPGGDIASTLARFGPFPVSVIRKYTPQLLAGLAYLHDNTIVH
eukprot:UC1_evm1s1105